MSVAHTRSRARIACPATPGGLHRLPVVAIAPCGGANTARPEVSAGPIISEHFLMMVTFADNARNHGGYDKTWHWYGRGHFEAVQPTDVVSRGRLPARGSPLQRSLQRGHTHPALGVAYSPMIRKGIDPGVNY